MLISRFLYLYHPYSSYSLPHKLMPYLSFFCTSIESSLNDFDRKYFPFVKFRLNSQELKTLEKKKKKKKPILSNQNTPISQAIE